MDYCFVIWLVVDFGEVYLWYGFVFVVIECFDDVVIEFKKVVDYDFIFVIGDFCSDLLYVDDEFFD